MSENMKIYVASSWRNEQQPEVVAKLRAAGYDVYDFKNPKAGDHGFHWKDVALERDGYGRCAPAALREALKHPRAVEGFASDFGAMKWADACVLLLPCGRSAHLEAGWMAGAGKKVIVLAAVADMEPELMYGLLTADICTSLDEAMIWLGAPNPMFPVLFGHGEHRKALERLNCPRKFPWRLLAAHEAQALENHDQSLKRLAERGGLSPCEMLAVLEDRPWRRMDLDIAVQRLTEHATKDAGR